MSTHIDKIQSYWNQFDWLKDQSCWGLVETHSILIGHIGRSNVITFEAMVMFGYKITHIAIFDIRVDRPIVGHTDHGRGRPEHVHGGRCGGQSRTLRLQPRYHSPTSAAVRDGSSTPLTPLPPSSSGHAFPLCSLGRWPASAASQLFTVHCSLFTVHSLERGSGVNTRWSEKTGRACGRRRISLYFVKIVILIFSYCVRLHYIVNVTVHDSHSCAPGTLSVDVAKSALCDVVTIFRQHVLTTATVDGENTLSPYDLQGN